MIVETGRRVIGVVEFATKPQLARRMLERLIAVHGKQVVPWFTADEAN